MQINGEKFLNNINSIKFKKNIFLISGNEDGFINKIKKLIINKLKLENFNEIETTNNILIGSKEVFFSDSQSLFYDKKIIIHLNPKDIKIENKILEEKNNNAVIILYSKTITGTKIKKLCDDSTELYSITCYKISQNFKKQVIDSFFNTNNIKLKNDAYWFFFDNSSEKYQLLENELSKILNFKKNNQSISLEEIKKLISLDSELEIEEIFFNIFFSNKKIITKTNAMIKSSSDSYMLLQKVKFYFELLIKTKIEMSEFNDQSIKEKNFPKYLFKHKKSYNLIVDKLDRDKGIKCFKLINKTEVLLRKNDSMFLSISQRFLLNLKKAIM